MKVFVVGANGQIGRHLVEKLAAKGDQVTVGVRQPAEQAIVKAANVQYVLFNLTWSVEKMATAFAGQEAIIFAAGSAGKDLLRVDLNGAVKTMQAAEKSDTKRYLLVSSVNADQPDKWAGSLENYFIAKHYADEWLLHRTDLNYLLIRPVSLTNESGSGKITLNAAKSGLQQQVSRENVASLLAELIHRPELKQLELTVTDGETPISMALEQLSAQEWRV
ncbi:SDR family oxidoreductase [Lapidilactobacillus wuchangensis]|uniref:SDR family oxidoreductase n=1 Tax=Lapidilactobacillus wuchangensis TaxID=2486001 RepID=UPI000F76BD53|nr:SDR family oxidoreductase [Lapidilactobacillus wuchangensis]